MKMQMRIAIAIVALAACVLPATALANSQGQSHGNSQNAPGHNKSSGSSSTTTTTARSQAEKQCRQERTTLGKSTFDQTYGTNKNGKNAFGKCVAHRTQQNGSTQTSATTSAQKSCRAEQQADPAAFKAKYGTNANKSNAFGKCVSQHARSSSQHAESQQVQAEENAARQCRTEEQTDSTAFKAKYGTNANKSNAFGKCVSQHARSQEQKSGSTSGSSSG